ncbi:MAG TPA: amidohydrolase [Kofleriaceae bacterium]|nr:amidohydrolase [Kofleriaceae bacterium]
MAVREPSGKSRKRARRTRPPPVAERTPTPTPAPEPIAIPTPAAAVPNLAAAVDEALPAATRAYRWFHRHPELSGAEVETARHLANELRVLGLEVTEHVGGHGVVGVLEGRGGDGPTVLVRADMDALPVTEETGLPYASANRGVMHACGHDVHMACAIGAMRVLAGRQSLLRGRIVFVGQPAEETGVGARAVLEDRAFRQILARTGTPQVALALHDAADLPAGSVSLLAGYAHANIDTVDVTVFGRGGHAAKPHLACDPIVLGAEIVLSLQTIVSRRLPAGERAVVTIGQFTSGHKHNVIPDSATLLITLRSYREVTRRRLLDEIARIARHVARAHDAPRDPAVVVREGEHTPAAYNDPAWTGRLAALFRHALGEDRVDTHEPSLGGEDFGRFSQTLGIPGVMWKIGAVDPKRFDSERLHELPGLHSPRFAPAARPTLRTGILTLALAVEDVLRPA